MAMTMMTMEVEEEEEEEGTDKKVRKEHETNKQKSISLIQKEKKKRPHPISTRTEADSLEYSMISRLGACAVASVEPLGETSTALTHSQTCPNKDAPIGHKGMGFCVSVSSLN